MFVTGILICLRPVRLSLHFSSTSRSMSSAPSLKPFASGLQIILARAQYSLFFNPTWNVERKLRDKKKYIKMQDLNSPSAVFVAQVFVGPSKQLKQIIQTEHNIVTRIPTDRRQTSWLLTSVAQDLKLGLPWNKIRQYCESDTLPLGHATSGNLPH